MISENQKAYNDRLRKDMKLYFTGNLPSHNHRLLNVKTDTLYAFSALDIQNNLLRLVNDEQFGSLEFLEKFRNKNGGLVLGLNTTNLNFSVLSSTAETKDLFFTGLFKTATGIMAGTIHAKGIKEQSFLFIPNALIKGSFYMYFPMDRFDDLTGKYLAGDLDDRLEYIYRNMQSQFTNGTINDDVFKEY
jgi:hypothetical protein